LVAQGAEAQESWKQPFLALLGGFAALRETIPLKVISYDWSSTPGTAWILPLLQKKRQPGKQSCIIFSFFFTF
jgi:hypothetical protein